MAKINRRDYLRSMAVSAAAIAASKLEVFGQGTRKRTQKAPAREEEQLETIDPLVEYFQQWPGVTTRPANPEVLVTFHGLLDFYYNSSDPNLGTCGVGFPQGGGHHSRLVEVYENGSLKPTQSIPINNNSELKLGIVKNPNEELRAKVEFLKTNNGDADDFRWNIDMQSRPWYRGVPTKAKPGYAARLFVRQGIFFTRKHTKFSINKVTKVEVGTVSYWTKAKLGYPGEIIGAAINLASDERVLLNVNGSEISLPYNATKKYEVRFSHSCHDKTPNGPCDFKPKHFQEVKRNDFHHHRDALDLPVFSEKYTVVLTPGQVVMKSNDAAPCIGAGYGGGNGPA